MIQTEKACSCRSPEILPVPPQGVSGTTKGRGTDVAIMCGPAKGEIGCRLGIVRPYRSPSGARPMAASVSLLSPGRTEGFG